MADILIDNQAAPGANPASGKSILWVDQTTKKLVQTDDAGNHLGVLSRNQMVAASQVWNATNTYVQNSGLLVPSFGMKVGQLYSWLFNISKTAAGTTAATVIISTGPNQSTGDTTRLTLTQTVAQAATAWSTQMWVTAYVTAVGAATGVIAGCFGFAGGTAFGSGKDAQSGTFDNTSMAGLYVGVQVNPQTAGVWTCTGVWAEMVG